MLSCTRIFFLLSSLLLLVSQVCYAQDTPLPSNQLTKESYTSISTTYTSDMLRVIGQMDRAMTTQELINAASQFEVIGQQAPTEWLPPYYAAYCYTVMAFMTKKDLTLKDTYLISAQYHLDKALRIDSNNVEVLVVQAYIYQMKVDVNPTNRLQEYGTLALMSLEKATTINPNNPRIYYLQAQNLFFAPPYAGGGLDRACPIATIAASKYETYSSPSTLHPKWGEAMTNYMQRVCQSISK